jgi:hypothetical protein
MNWADKRRIVYFTIFVIFIIVVIGIPGYILWYKPPTCFDNKKNQGEQEIDCGGPCVKLCKAQEVEPVVEWQQIFRVTPDVYTAVAYVHNPNLGAESINAPYTFTLYSETNNKITTRKGHVYIPPGKSFAVIDPGIIIRGEVPVRAIFEFDNEYTWRGVSGEQIALEVRNKLLTDPKTSPTLEADIFNPSFNDVREVDIGAVLYDTQGNAFAASKTIIDNLDKKSSQHVVFTWPEPFTKAVSRIEIIPIVR